MANKTKKRKKQQVSLTTEELNLIPKIQKIFLRTNTINRLYGIAIVNEINWKYKDKLQTTFTEARLRKCVNHIRGNSILPIISSSTGYYISWDPEDILEMIVSLKSRVKSITSAADGLYYLLVQVKMQMEEERMRKAQRKDDIL